MKQKRYDKSYRFAIKPDYRLTEREPLVDSETNSIIQ